MEINKLRRSLEVVFEYSHRTIGTFIAITAVWMYFTGTLSDKRFWLGLGAAVALGFFGPKANLDFFRGRSKQKKNGDATDSNG